MIRKLAILVCLSGAGGLLLNAQTTAGTGSISGVVTDITGALVPDASVVVENPSKGIRRELVTTDGGVFNAPSLVPAPGYAVTITKSGFANYEAKEITLNVGQVLNLKPILQVSTSVSRVEVTSEAPIVETSRPDVSALVSSRQIMDLPINGRRVDNFVLLAPAVTSDASFGLITFRGLAGGNSFLTDGVDTTNNFYDENAGRTRTYNISQDSVQEFQVVTSGSLAEYGRASGGVVNTITRSGTNDVHGTAYWFFRNRTLNATDLSTKAVTPGGINPQDSRHQAGLSIGGPIIKDKLFFFFNGELQRRYFPIASSNLSNKQLWTPSNTINPATCTATAAQCAAAINYIQSRAQPQLVPRNADNNLMFGKIDYQINPNNRASFELNYLDFRSPNGIQTQSSLTDGSAVGNNANTTVFDRTGKVGLTSILSPTMVNEFRFGYFKDRQYDPNDPALLPSIGPIGLSITGTNAISNIGYATAYNRLNPSEQRFQVADTLSYTVGKHSMKFGFDYSNVEDYVSVLRNAFGTYTYPSLTAFAQDFSGNTSLGKRWTSFTQQFGNPTVDTFVNELAGFIQDEWRVTPKLTISPGVRYELTRLPQPIQEAPNLVNPRLPQTNTIPQTELNFMPRFGLAYAINDKTVFRADYGMFYNRYVTSVISNFFTANGTYQSNFSLNGTNPAQQALGPVFPNSLAAPPPGSSSTLTPAYADVGFRPSYSEQGSASIERQLTRDSSLTVSYLWNRGLHLVSGYDANVAAPTQSYTYPILTAPLTAGVTSVSSSQVAGFYTTPLYTQRLNPAFNTVLAVTSSKNSYYNGLVIQYKKRYSSWLQSQVSYTWSHAIDDNVNGGNSTLFTPSFPTSVFNGDYKGERGSASTDQRHRLVANAIFSPKFSRGDSWADRFLINNWQLSVLTTAASGQPLVPTVSVSTGPNGRLLTSTLNGLGGSTRVPFESISALNGDQLYRTDARISKILPFSEHFRVTLLFEAFNVFNHSFYSGTVPRIAQQFSTSSVTLNGASVFALVPFASYGAYSTSSAPLEGTTARRAQAALRIEF